MMIKRLLVPLLLSMLCALAFAQDTEQNAESAYTNYAEPLRFAYATQMLEIQLGGVSASGESVAALNEEDESGEEESGEEESEENEAPLGFADSELLDLFSGSLQTTDPELLSRLEEVLTQVDTATGDDLTAAIEHAQTLLTQARDLLVAEDVQRDPVFTAALISQLLLFEGGIADNYEEADETAWAFPVAWAGVQRVKALWGTLEPGLDSSRTSEITRSLDTLDQLLASPVKPATLGDPEDVETAANDLVFGLETALDTQLMPRALSASLSLLRQQTTEACDKAAAENFPLEAEGVAAAHDTYRQFLSDAFSVLDPDNAERLSDLLVSSLPDALEAADPAAAGAACQQIPELLDALEAVVG